MVLESVVQGVMAAHELPIIDQIGILVEELSRLIVRVQVVLKTAQVALTNPPARSLALLLMPPGAALLPDHRTGISVDGPRRLLVVIQPVAEGRVTTQEPVTVDQFWVTIQFLSRLPVRVEKGIKAAQVPVADARARATLLVLVVPLSCCCRHHEGKREHSSQGADNQERILQLVHHNMASLCRENGE